MLFCRRLRPDDKAAATYQIIFEGIRTTLCVAPAQKCSKQWLYTQEDVVGSAPLQTYPMCILLHVQGPVSRAKSHVHISHASVNAMHLIHPFIYSIMHPFISFNHYGLIAIQIISSFIVHS